MVDDLIEQTKGYLTASFKRDGSKTLAVSIATNSERNGRKFSSERVERGGYDELLPLGSQTKTITAVAVLQLVEMNCINLDDSFAEQFFDKEQFLEIQNTPFAKVTVRDILSHKGGLSYADNEIDLPYAYEGYEEELADWVIKNATYIHKQEDANVSNVGYIMLGRLVEHVTGSSLKSFVQDNIIERLEMPLYHTVDSPPEGSENGDGVFKAAGGYFGSAEAIAGFYQDLFNGRLLSDAMLSEMKKAEGNFFLRGGQHEGLSFGLGIVKMGNAYGHLGTWGSYRCFTAWNESLNKTFSMTAGSTHEDGVIKTMVPMVQGWMNIFEKDGLTL